MTFFVKVIYYQTHKSFHLNLYEARHGALCFSLISKLSPFSTSFQFFLGHFLSFNFSSDLYQLHLLLWKALYGLFYGNQELLKGFLKKESATRQLTIFRMTQFRLGTCTWCEILIQCSMMMTPWDVAISRHQTLMVSVHIANANF